MHNDRQSDGTEEGCGGEVKPQSQADPGSTSAVTSDDNHYAFSTARDVDSRESAIMDDDSDETYVTVSRR